MTYHRTCSCGTEFEANRKDKLSCSPACAKMDSEIKSWKNNFNVIADRYLDNMKKYLDSQVKVYTNKEYSQEFLRGLIPK